mmetsp:Transcript_80446/g.186792  ORF Transcript_80446/g.186792 Transcript_80446/m.186792 type:complete len:88 (-) Transcript_80446:1003-1266(-)
MPCLVLICIPDAEALASANCAACVAEAGTGAAVGADVSAADVIAGATVVAAVGAGAAARNESAKLTLGSGMRPAANSNESIRNVSQT